MRKKLTAYIFKFSLFIIILTTNISYLPTQIVSASEANDSKLVSKISKDYTKKFCNSVGFGLSKDSAMRFSFSENKQIFKNRKGIEKIEKELLAQAIANSVIDSCGYQLDLYGDKDIEEFANSYLSLDQESS